MSPIFYDPLLHGRIVYEGAINLSPHTCSHCYCKSDPSTTVSVAHVVCCKCGDRMAT